MMALVKLCYVCVYDFYNVMYSSDPQLLTWLLNRKAPTAKEESNYKEEEEWLLPKRLPLVLCLLEKTTMIGFTEVRTR